jgi:uncharacterized protein (TIGR02246 family)
MAVDALGQLRRYHHALNRCDAGGAMAFFAPDAVYVSPGVNGRIEGRDAIIAAFTAYFAEHPDQHAIDEFVELVAPDVVRSLWRLEATSASTGARYQRRGVETVTFDSAGLIVRVEVEDR